jgi:hypothetical protein
MKKMRLLLSFLLTALILGLNISPVEAQNQFDQVGTFESNLPAFWNIGHEPTGSTLTWATDQYLSMGHSIKIEKSATSDTAAWVSSNMCDIWSATISANVDLHFGAWIKTQNVNTNPTSPDQMWYIAYSFYDSAGALIGTVELPIDQSVASSTNWMADTTAVGQISLPKTAWKMIISFVGGKNATGTVWADNFIFEGRGGWAGQDWNTQLGVPTGMYYWLPPNGGNDGLLNDGFENTEITTEAAHSGTHSLKFYLPSNRETHDGFVSTIRMPFSKIDPTIKPGDVLRIAVWIKADSLQPDSAAKYPSTWSVGLTPGFFSTVNNNAGYNPVGQQNDYQWAFPHVTSFDWTQYYLDIQVPNDTAAHALEVRLHVYSTFTGIVYFDDLTVTKIEVPALTDIGSFEQTLPSFWTMGNQPTGSTLSWATDQSLSMGHSLKIEKTAVGDSASWISQNMCAIWSPTISANVDLHFGAWIKTQNVNTNPTSPDQMWYIAYSFYDSAGALIGTTELPIDQSTATSTGWVADTTAVGQVSLPKAAWKMIISFVGGKNATGTVWADNFIFEGRGGWAGQDWNTQLGVPTGWYYWLPPIGGNDGVLSNGFENTVVTDSTSHSGLYSLEFNMPITRQVHDGFVGTMRYLLDGSDFTMGKVSANSQQDIAHLTNILPGDSIRISVWIKASGLYPDSAAKYPSTWAVGLTPGFFSTNNNNAGYNPLPGSQNDYQFTFPTATSFDWTKFNLDIQVPDTSLAKAMEVRLHVYSTFAGKVFFDDLTIQKISSVTSVNMNHLVPASFMVYQNYPNPFNPSTMISYFLPNASKVKIVIYDMLGREVATLVNNFQNSGSHEVVWNGDNNFGEKVASGAYIYRVVAGNNIATKKMILLK